MDPGVLDCVCVFCGSSPGRRSEYAEAARDLGTALARRGLGLVYGGGKVGLMGVVADAVLDAGGQVLGVIPGALHELEVGHQGLTRLEIVNTMHERKALMAESSRAFLAMPGGIGTFEELCEVLTWSQLGIHAKPVALLDVGGYWQPLLAMLDHAVEEGFLPAATRERLWVASDPARLLDAWVTSEWEADPGRTSVDAP